MTSSAFVRYASVLFLGSVLGWGFSQLLLSDPEEGPIATAASSPDTGGAEPPSASLETPRQPARPSPSSDDVPVEPLESERTPVESEEEPLITERLLAYARENIQLGWKQIRPEDSIPPSQEEEAVEKYEKIVLVSPEVLGQTFAKDQNDLDAARDHGAGFALLELMLKSKAGEESTRVAHDPEAMAAFFEPETSGPTLNGFDFDGNGELADGTTLVYPPGVYRLSLRAHHLSFPSDLTIRGAGMDQTYLLIEELYPRSILKNLTIENCTVNASGYLTDLRREPCSLKFENARFIGFDLGAGSSCLIAAPSGVLFARNCVFDGRYGRNPGSGQVFDIRSGGLLARFENCEFNLVELNSGRYSKDVRIVYSGCRFIDTMDRMPDGPPTNLFFPGTTVEYYDRSKGSPEPRDVNELFPDWQARLNQ